MESAAAATPLPSPAKKTLSSPSPLPTGVGAAEVSCQVEGCGTALGSAKEYHRKHRVCEAHSKCPRVLVSGQERRFCQQCSRFHALSEFDQKKRSCRRRLSDHNARRRKPPPESFMSGCRSSPLSLGGAQQISFVWDKNMYDDGSSAASYSWDTHSTSKPSEGKDLHFKAANTEAFDGKLQLGRHPLPNAFSSLYNERQDMLHTNGMEASSVAASIIHEAPDLQTALSLLSSCISVGAPDLVPTPSLMQFPDAVQDKEVPLVFHAFYAIATPSQADHIAGNQRQGGQLFLPACNTCLFG